MTDAPPHRHVLITGGSSGLGLALARRLCAEGSRVAIAARSAERLAEAHRAVAAAQPGARLRTLQCDVTDAASCEAVVAAAEHSDGPLELVIACAGTAEPGRFADLPAEAFRAQMEVNFFGALNIARPALARMRARGRGRALLIGSAASLIGFPGHSAYAPGKFALRGLAQALAAEAAPDGVQVSIAFPADLDTPGLAAERPKMPPELAAISALGGVMSPDKAARRILRGVARGRREIHPTWASFALARLAPLVWPLVVRRLEAEGEKGRAEAHWDSRLPKG